MASYDVVVWPRSEHIWPEIVLMGWPDEQQTIISRGEERVNAS